MLATLVSIQQLTPSVSTFFFKPEQQFKYTAGQFIELYLPHDDPDDRGLRRWFTLSSSPTEDLLSITTKRADKHSTFKLQLFNLNVGQTVHITQAMGDFVLPRDATIPLVFVIIGMGITPMHSMLQWLSDTKQTRDITSLYAARSTKDIIFKSLVEEHSKSTQYFVDGTRLTTNDIISASNKLNHPMIYLSGPEEIVEVLVAELREQGVSNARLVTDYFPGYGSL